MQNNFLKNPQLDGKSFFLEGDKDTCIILIHGFTATTVEVRPLSDHLNQVGFTTYAPLLPGHGTKPEDLNKIKWKNWVDEVVRIYENCSSEYQDVFIGGESMGGVIACYMAATFRNISGLLLFAPAIIVENLRYSSYLRFFKKEIPKKTSNNNANKEIFPWQGYDVYPTNAAFQFLQLQRITKNKLSSISQPTIIFQGKYDKTISPEGPILIYDKIQTSQKDFILLENSGHCVLLDQDFLYMARRTVEFINRYSKH